jgi:hypothetical protein
VKSTTGDVHQTLRPARAAQQTARDSRDQSKEIRERARAARAGLVAANVQARAALRFA